jgi:pyruvate-formate lyase-activating enzyme
MTQSLEKIGFYTLSDERARNASVDSQMMRGEIIITEYCNFKCPYCRGLKPEVFGDRAQRQLSLAEVASIIDSWSTNASGLPIKNIRFSGGEPTLHKNIREIVAYAKTRGVERIAISSNGASPTALYHELIDLGVNDFSISLDACCSEVGDKMAGGVKGAFDKVAHNIKVISARTYVTVGVVMTPENIAGLIETIKFADSLGVSDIRIISAAQWNKPLPDLDQIPAEILAKYPILRYRVEHFRQGINVRGLTPADPRQCGLTLDDSVVAGTFHYPCVIYMREGGSPIGPIGPDMRKERAAWYARHDCFADPICRNNCLDVCVDYNRRFQEAHAIPSAASAHS